MPLLRTSCLLLAILAVACAQVFGIQRGYLCDHQEVAIETDAQHCHPGGDGFEACPNAAPDADGCCQENSEPAPHTPLKVELNASTASNAASALPAFVAVLVAETPLSEWVLAQFLPRDGLLKVPLNTGGKSPPASLQVARCMVILV